jgi:hypothetical protein
VSVAVDVDCVLGENVGGRWNAGNVKDLDVDAPTVIAPFQTDDGFRLAPKQIRELMGGPAGKFRRR